MYRSMLLPVDLEQENSWTKALPVALRLRESFGADLHLLTVVPDVSHSYVAQYFPVDFEERITRQTSARLESFAREKAGNVAPGCHVGHGRVYDEILSAAERLGCDLIVMAAHRPTAADYLIGPNAARVVSHANCSVLVVRD